VDQYNEGYGPMLHRIVFIPLQVLDVLFSALVPIYNAIIKLLRILFIDVLVDSLVANVKLIGEFGAAFAAMCKHTAVQVPSYIERIATACDYGKEGDLCYEPGNGRVFDLITVMADVRNMDAALSKLLLGVCASAAGPLNIVMFPLMDINLAKAVHNIVNSVLYMVVQLPSVTAQRCLNHGIIVGGTRSGTALMMCIPDFSPPINMMVAGIRDLGVVIDNWIDVSSIIVQRMLRILSDDEATCEQQAKSLAPAFYSRQLFGSANNRPKVVVGLTPGLYSITDGMHAQYFNHYDSVDTLASPYVWPIEIDTRYGVAAVTFRANSGSEERDGSGETTTTMMGCRCIDNEGLPPMRVQCALALKNVGVAASAAGANNGAAGGNDNDPAFNLQAAFNNVFDVVFQQRSTADYMTCAMAQISVQSVRWPATRFTGRYAIFFSLVYSIAVQKPQIYAIHTTWNQFTGCSYAYDMSATQNGKSFLRPPRTLFGASPPLPQRPSLPRSRCLWW
jgi:hypothetical protein